MTFLLKFISNLSPFAAGYIIKKNIFIIFGLISFPHFSALRRIWINGIPNDEMSLFNQFLIKYSKFKNLFRVKSKVHT